MFTESQDKAGVSARMTILWSPCCGRAVAAVAAPAQVFTSESVGPGEHKASTYSSSNLFQNVSPNDCSFNSSTGHSLRQDLRFFQVLKFNVILKHSISNSKFRTGHDFLFNVVLSIHPSCPFKSVKSFNGVNQTQMIDCQPESCVTQKAECID